MLAYRAMTPETNPNPYLVQKIMTASPEELISYIYEAGIKACFQENQSRALEAVQQLINALNFDAGEISNNFYQVYSTVQNHLYKNEFEAAREILVDLRKTWTEAMRIN